MTADASLRVPAWAASAGLHGLALAALLWIGGETAARPPGETAILVIFESGAGAAGESVVAAVPDPAPILDQPPEPAEKAPTPTDRADLERSYETREPGPDVPPPPLIAAIDRIVSPIDEAAETVAAAPPPPPPKPRPPMTRPATPIKPPTKTAAPTNPFDAAVTAAAFTPPAGAPGPEPSAAAASSGGGEATTRTVDTPALAGEGDRLILREATYRRPPAAPVYPKRVAAMGVTGTVVLRLLIGPDGAPRELKVWRSSGVEALDASAIDAARRWEFVPAHHAGKPIDAWVEIPVHFNLKG